jgi:YD repeat-containing protein
MTAAIQDSIQAEGRIHIQRWDASGALVEQRNVENLLVQTGLNYIASRIKDATATVMSHMALGAGTAAASNGQTALVTELGRVALTSTTLSANVVTYTATFSPATATGAVTEAAIFNAASAGTMLNRVAFPVVNKQAGDTVAVTWTVTINAA